MLTNIVFKNRYRLLAELGKGGMGVVYRAHDTLLERDVAIKILSSSDLGSEGRARLLHEAQSAAKLNHPNIVSIYDAGEEEKQSFIIMELLDGSSLFEKKSKSLEEIIDISGQICNALEHAHTHGIIHRDLKPENVIVKSNGQVKLTDFGLARSIASRISVDGAIIGTVFYMSPEQALGQSIDGRTDLYALGAMMYELVAGRLPFSADDPLAVISQHLYAPIIPPSNFNPDIPPPLDNLILKLLSKRPEDRPESASDVRSALDSETLAIEDSRSERSDIDVLVRGRLVGRDDEIAHAKSLWRQAAFSSPVKSTLLISGESGIGKTPFVREIKALVEITGGRAFTGECYTEGSAPYSPILNIIREALYTPAIHLHDFVIADLIKLAPDLRARYPQVVSNQPFDPATDQQRLFESFVALCTELTSHSPVLIVIEDVQWADGGTLALLRHLARRVKSAGLPMMIVITCREVELETAGSLTNFIFDQNRENLIEIIKLTPYNKEKTREFLEVMFQEQVSDDFLDKIYLETEGNLFYIEEMCKALIEQGKLFRKNGKWQNSNLNNIKLPQSVRLAIQARLNKLAPSTLDVLVLAAAIGREFDFQILRKSCEKEEEALIEALENAQHAQLIYEVETDWYRRSNASNEIFAFAHGLVVATLLESVSGLRRHRLHKRVAESIESLHPDDFAALAYHHEKATDVDQACYYYTKAGERALEVYANQEAEKYFRSAENLTHDDRLRGHLLAGIGEALFRQSLYGDAIKSWKTAIDLYKNQGENDQVARLYARAARAAWYASDTPGGLELCLEGMRMVPKNFDSPGTAALLHETARAYFFNNSPEEALPLCQRALEMAKRLDLPEVQAEALATLGILPNQPFEDKRRALKEAIEIAEGARLWASAARAHLNMGGRLHEVGELQKARVHYLYAYESAQKMGNATWMHDFLGTACAVSLEMGDFDYVEDTLPELDQLLDTIPNREISALYDTLLEAQLLTFKGNWEKSLDLIKTCERSVEKSPDVGIKTRFYLITANSLLETDNAQEAINLLRDVIYKESGEFIEDYIPVALMLTRAYIKTDDLDSAEHLIKDVIADNPASDNKMTEINIKSMQALMASARGKHDEAVSIYEQLLELTEECHLLWTKGMVYLEYSTTLINRGGTADLQQAHLLLKQAEKLFQDIKAPGYYKLAEEKVAAIQS